VDRDKAAVNPRRAPVAVSHVQATDKLARAAGRAVALAADRQVVQAAVLPYLLQRNTAPAVVGVN